MDRLPALGIEALHVDFGHPDDASFFGIDSTCRQHFRHSEMAGIRTTAFALNVLETTGIAAEVASRPSAAALCLVREAIDMAARWSVPLVYVPHFGRARIDSEDAFRAAVALLRTACEFAETSEVCIATENVLPPTQGRRLLDEVSHPKLRALADLYNPVLHGYVVREVLEALLPYLAHDIHVKDGRDGVLGNAAVGEGDARFEDSTAFLLQHAFGCTAILENSYAEDSEARLRRDIDRVRRELQPILARTVQPSAQAAVSMAPHDRA